MIRNRYVIVICAIWVCLPASAQNMAWLLKAEYEVISEFSEGIAAVKKNGKWGYVSEQGTEILAPAYEVAYPFHEGMAVLASNDHTLVAIVDRSGKLTRISDKMQIDSRFAVFSDGLLLVAKGKKKGYLNTEGRLSIDCKYDFAQPFSEGLAAAVLDSRQCYCWYYIDVNGRAVFHLSDLKKDVYWALGFHEGIALVLHSKGAIFVNKNGQELKVNMPQITPPEDAAYYSKESLACKEGILTFDSRCRAVSFTAKNGKETIFIPTPNPKSVSKPEYKININGTVLADNNIRWINSSTAVVKTSDSKFGMLTAFDTPVLAFSLSEDTLTSALGNQVTTNLNVRNTSSKLLDNVDIKVNEKSFEAVSLENGSSVSYPLSFDKTTNDAIETKDIAIAVWQDGLQIAETKKTLWIEQALPSLSINVPVSRVAIRLGQSAYTVGVQVSNLSNMPVSNLQVTIDRQTQTIAHLGGGESATVQFSFSSPNASTVRTLTVSVKPPNAPPVTANARITIDVPVPPPPTF